MTVSLENDALDFTTNDDSYEISTTPEDFVKMNKALEAFGVTDFIMNEVRFIPSNYISSTQVLENWLSQAAISHPFLFQIL